MEGDPRNPKTSLLKKYDIPVEHLSYEYVEKCTDKKELERIVRILRSGEEGCYPDLLKVTEDRLRLYAPESRVLRFETPILTKDSIPPEDWKLVESELLSWEQEMTIIDKSLDFEKGRKDVVGSKNMPSVRKVVEPKCKSKINEKKHVSNSTNQHIKSSDYDAWEKFDVDKELLKIDVEEERKEEERKKKKKELQKIVAEKKIDIDLDKDSYTKMEQQVLANQAKDRGNECYKSGDLVNALKYYNLSIKLYSTANAFNNRAMTYLKLNQFENVVSDCNVVLGEDKHNIKALHRRATAYQNLANNNNSNSNNNNNNFNMLALDDLKQIVLLEPNNKIAQADLQKLKTKLGIHDVGKKFRMPICENDSFSGSQLKDNKTGNHQSNSFSISDLPNNVEKLPLTYYGPSTSTFQCEPYSMVHHALCGSLSSTEVLCKCNSNIPRQNPLCQKCGEIMSRPKTVAKPTRVQIKNETNKKATNDAKNIKQKLESEKKAHADKTDSSESNSSQTESSKASKEIKNEASANRPMGKEVEEIKKVEPAANAEKISNTDIAESGNVRKANVSSTMVAGTSSLAKQTGVDENAREVSENIPNSKSSLKVERQVKETERQTNSGDAGNLEKLSLTGTPTTNVKESSQKTAENSSGKLKSKKKKSRERQRENKMLKELEVMTPGKVVHAAKYLHPTSVEPKVKAETPEKTQPEVNLTKGTGFKAFVPNKQCLGVRRDESLMENNLHSSSPPRKSLEPVTTMAFDVGNNSSLEGNKENFLSHTGNAQEKPQQQQQQQHGFFGSAYEFVKTWEEMKKLDPNYSKRAEIIRLIRPTDLAKVIGIKLDSEMLSSILECLEKQFAETEPKVVVEFLKQLPQIPRFGLIKMFLADADKKTMKNLVTSAESKGFVVEEDVKKALALIS